MFKCKPLLPNLFGHSILSQFQKPTVQHKFNLLGSNGLLLIKAQNRAWYITSVLCWLSLDIHLKIMPIIYLCVCVCVCACTHTHEEGILWCMCGRQKIAGRNKFYFPRMWVLGIEHRSSVLVVRVPTHRIIFGPTIQF